MKEKILRDEPNKEMNEMNPRNSLYFNGIPNENFFFFLYLLKRKNFLRRFGFRNEVKLSDVKMKYNGNFCFEIFIKCFNTKTEEQAIVPTWALDDIFNIISAGI